MFIRLQAFKREHVRKIEGLGGSSAAVPLSELRKKLDAAEGRLSGPGGSKHDVSLKRWANLDESNTYVELTFREDGGSAVEMLDWTNPSVVSTEVEISQTPRAIVPPDRPASLVLIRGGAHDVTLGDEAVSPANGGTLTGGAFPGTVWLEGSDRPQGLFGVAEQPTTITVFEAPPTIRVRYPSRS